MVRLVTPESASSATVMASNASFCVTRRTTIASTRLAMRGSPGGPCASSFGGSPPPIQPLSLSQKLAISPARLTGSAATENGIRCYFTLMSSMSNTSIPEGVPGRVGLSP